MSNLRKTPPKDEIIKVKEFVKNDTIKEVESEEEYWRIHGLYMVRMKKLRLSFKKFMYYPEAYIKEFETIMSEMVGYGIIDLATANKQREKLYNKINQPNEFKTWIWEKLNKVNSKLSKKK